MEMSIATLRPYLISAANVCTRVFVIVMTQTFMCFLNFHPTKEYMEYLRYDNSEQQRASGAFLTCKSHEHCEASRIRRKKSEGPETTERGKFVRYKAVYLCPFTGWIQLQVA